MPDFAEQPAMEDVRDADPSVSLRGSIERKKGVV